MSRWRLPFVTGLAALAGCAAPDAPDTALDTAEPAGPVAPRASVEEGVGRLSGGGIVGRLYGFGLEVDLGAEAPLVVTTRALSRDDARQEVGPADLARDGSCRVLADGECTPTVEISREGLVEWWAAVPQGLEHGWSIEAPLQGQGPLTIEVEVEGAAVAPLGDAAGALILTPDGSRSRYFAARAHDAVGEPLAAIIEVDGSRIFVVVDDADAIYPIEVDPLLTSPEWSVESNVASARLGNRVVYLDVNGDGYDDLAASAAGTDRVYGYAGSATGLATTTAWTYAASGTSFGDALAAGDVNGDTYDDLIVGAPTGGTGSAGAVYIFHGSSTGLATTPSRTLTHTVSGSQFGFSVSSDDVTGDGYDDLLVGAPYADVSALTDIGRAYAYHGSASGIPSTSVWDTIGTSVGEQHGYAVLLMPRLNGLMYADAVVGRPASDTVATDAGEVVWYPGSSTGLGATGTPLYSSTMTANGRFGTQLGWGDFNGGSYNELVVGAQAHSSSTGRVYVYQGAFSGPGVSPVTPIATITGPSTGSLFGASLASGDVDNDASNLHDLCVGAPGYSSSAGLVRCYPGTSSTVSGSPFATLTGSAGEEFGYSVALGRPYGETKRDLVVGLPGYTSGSSGEGALELYAYDSDGDGVGHGLDCDETDSSRYPGATERVANGVDEDCDGKELCYRNSDGDAYGSPTTMSSADMDCVDGSESAVSGDCDDTTSSIYPGATEIIGNEIDEDCNGGETCYLDNDSDAYGGTTTKPSSDVDCKDLQESSRSTDCDDAVTARTPGKAEIIGSNLDENCDLVEICYTDSDGDTYGTAVTRSSTTDQDCLDAGEATRSGDCNDASSAVRPGATETVGNDVDENCDNNLLCYVDSDNDTYGTTVTVTAASATCVAGSQSTLSTDCNDGSTLVRPGASEIVNNGVDEDCNFADACWTDADNDNYGTSVVLGTGDMDCADSYEATVSGDCDDTATGATRYPGAPELVNNGIDEDCDAVDSCWTDADNDNYGTTTPRDSSDLDCDNGNMATVSTDCDDAAASDYPGAPETPGNLDDEDCNGFDSCYRDDDDDNFGITAVIVSSDLDCDNPFMAYVSTDCDDGQNTDYPGAPEIVDNSDDEDCDGVDSCYQDLDNDDYGTATIIDSLDLDCGDANESTRSSDCDDTLSTRNPGRAEVVNDGIDQDCDLYDSCYADADNDNYGSITVIDSADLDCADANEAPVSGDCDEVSGLDHPGATEVVNNGDDDDCDGFDSCYTDADNDNFGTTVVRDSTDLDCDNADMATVSTDCDDAVSGGASDYPGATEVVNNGDDDDCDGVDSCYTDADDDNYGTTAVIDSIDLDCDNPYAATVTTDCDDASSGDRPGATETIGNNDDENCDGREICYVDGDADGFGGTTTVLSADADCNDANESTVSTDCNDASILYNPTALETDCADPADYNCDGTTGFADADGDGTPACTDCDDTKSTVRPGATEIPADGIDQNCDGADVCYVNTDGDAYGTTATTTISTDKDCIDSGEASNSTDCDDASNTDYPGATETIGNNDDESCDGKEICWTDNDSDTYGSSVTVTSADADCGDTKEATRSGDCDDDASADKPGATEIVNNGDDEDCNGFEACYNDGDDDNFGTPTTRASSDLDCSDANESTVTTDCDDADAADFPGAAETVNNGDDEDCDGVDSCYTDADDDNYGTTVVRDSTDLDCNNALMASVSTDCDDASSGDHPGATEVIGNGNDEDCNAGEVCYNDGDDDDYGTASTRLSADTDCADTNESLVSNDCDDTSAQDYPGAVESVNNGDDEDCDGADACWTDADNDNYGTAVPKASADLDCLDALEATVSTDCDDTSAADYPGATETVNNSNDEDCDGVESCYTDADDDNYGTTVVKDSADLDCADAFESVNSTDCDDTRSSINAGATESINDGIDQDCDGVDSCYTDGDNDNFGTVVPIDSADLDCLDGNEASVSGDCNDSVTAINPGATETVNDGVDQDCDLVESCYTDSDDDNYGTTVVKDSADLDCADGLESTLSSDCDDSSASDYPGAPETVANGDDEDCDGADTCYFDSDRDAYGSTATKLSTDLDCTDSQEATNSTDCDDASITDYPGAPETVNNGDDEDCDGVESCYGDADDDNYGTAAVNDSADLDCADALEATVSTDCDDTRTTVYPGAAEIVNDGRDQDCDTFDSCYTDADNDDFGTAVAKASADLDCADSSEATVSTDCDDGSSSDYPGATEVVNNGDDEDCDTFDACYADADDDNYGTTAVIDSTDLDCNNALMATVSTDCDDASSADKPGATEIVGNNDDENCDGAEICYADIDLDLYGTSTTVTSADADCLDSGESVYTNDCNDGNAAYNPGAIESDCADPNDYNCDGSTGFADVDADGEPACTDCDDTKASVYTGAAEVVADGIDQDCNGGEICYADEDGDLYGGTATVASADKSCAGLGESTISTDCNDLDATVRPGAAESVNNGIDEDCDGVDSCWTDADNDDYGTTVSKDSADLDCADSNEATVSTDCNDASSSVRPGATEVAADGIDSDCNGGERCWTDADNDDYGIAASFSSADLDCVDDGEAAVSTDCNDASASQYPGAPETLADDIDQDCSGGDSCYSDADGDGYGTSTPKVSADADCDDAGEADDATDCNDAASSAHPGAAETTADEIDQDCDGGEICYVDIDLDGYGVSATVVSLDADCADDGESADETDCDDTVSTTSPGAPEACNGQDDDCDGTIDEDSAVDAVTWYGDADGDGHGDALVKAVSCEAPSGYVAKGDDCDDTDPAYNPSALETDCADPNDYNCDLSVAYTDADADGEPACVDCNDADPLVNSSAIELCNTIDDDCDALVDEDDAEDAPIWYADVDGDGYGETLVAAAACNQPTGYVALAGDCDDADPAFNPIAAETDCADPNDYNCDGSVGYDDSDADGFGACEECNDGDAAVNPGATEMCNGFDDNCDAVIDEATAADAPTWYADADEDGWGTDATGVAQCEAPTGYVAEGGDCDDNDVAYHPEAAETDCTDPNDYNCDGSVGFEDADADGYAACAECADGDAAVNPGAAEICNAQDDNCDGDIDEHLPDRDNDGQKDCFDEDDDNDGLTDQEEAGLGTSPLSADTDGDGVSDGDEVTAGTDPLVAQPLDDTGDDEGPRKTCGTTPGGASAGWALTGLLLLVRRRRTTTRVNVWS